MKVLELFAGERCIGRAFENRGHEASKLCEHIVSICERYIDIDSKFDLKFIKENLSEQLSLF